jgi:hypothetical protein
MDEKLEEIHWNMLISHDKRFENLKICAVESFVGL